MITLKTRQFMSFSFQQSFHKLANQALPVKMAYTVKKLTDKLEKERKRIQTEYLELIGLYAKKDEHGKLINPEPQDPNSFDVAEEKLEAYKAAEQEFGDRDVSVESDRLHIETLGNLSLSAAELTVLDPVLTDGSHDTAKVADVLPITGGA